jgi:hypothetical protein
MHDRETKARMKKLEHWDEMDVIGFYVLIGVVCYLGLLLLIDFGVPLMKRYHERRAIKKLWKAIDTVGEDEC